LYSTIFVRLPENVIAMRMHNVSDPVYAPNSKGGPKADPERYPPAEVWAASGEFVRSAYSKRKHDDDFGQAGTLVRKVMNDAQRDRLVSNVVGHLAKGVTEPVLVRAFEYWRNIDRRVGDRIADRMRGTRQAAE
jgi:catalase